MGWSRTGLEVRRRLSGSEAAPGGVAKVPMAAVVLPKDFKCKVSKEFIDEMATIADRCKKMKEQTGQMDWSDGSPLVPKRLRKLEEAYQRNELAKMKRMHCESAVFSAALGRGHGLHDAEGTMMTGQNVHHWWAKWFKTATTPKYKIAKSDRPKWYDATILGALGKKRVRYMGRWFDEPTYQVH